MLLPPEGPNTCENSFFYAGKAFGPQSGFFIFRPETARFEPARTIDPLFAKAFEEALEGGVELVTSKFFYEGIPFFWSFRIGAGLRKV